MDAYFNAFSHLPIFIVLCVVLVFWFISNHYKYWEKRNIPFVKPIPIVGNLSFILRVSVRDFFDSIRKKYPQDYLGLFMGWKPVLLVQTPELAKKVLIKDAALFADRYTYTGYSSDPLGSLNLFSVKDPIWSHMRHELAPMFNTMKLKTVTELMNKNASEMVRKVRRDYVDGNKPVILKELFSMYTSDTVAYTVFGLNASVLNDEPSALWVITNHMVKWNFSRGLEFVLIFLVPYLARLFRLKFFSKDATEYIKELFWKTIEERKTSKSAYDKDLVNHLLKLKDNMRLPTDVDSELADNLMLAQVAVFILGSIETSSSTLSYCVHELAFHPEVQEKLYKEINDAVTQKGTDILEYHDLLELKYLSACIYETLRKYPLLGYLDRVCKERYQLTDDVTVEKGTPVFVNVMALHYDEKKFPNPEEWNPDRKLLPASDNDNLECSFVPFGEGPRFCIGKRYGLMQVRAALAQLLHKFEVKPVSMQYKVTHDPYAVISSPLDGCSVKFLPRL